MKKIFTLLFLGTISAGAAAQPLLTENFNFTGALSANGWAVHSGTTGPVSTVAGLTYAGYPGSGEGNAAFVTGTSATEDVNRDFTSQNTSGTAVWTSFLVNVTDPAVAAGTYFLHLGNRVSGSTFTQFAPRVFAQTTAAGVLFGVSAGGAAVYATNTFTRNTTYLIYVKYTINTTGNDTTKIWVRTAGVAATEAALGTPDVEVNDQAGQDIISGIGLRQATGLPGLVVDAIRVGVGFASTLPSTLRNLNASVQNNNTRISFEASNEINVANYTIEKSADGRSFKTLAVLEARGGGFYQYTDVAPAGNAWYRIRTNDLDGRSQLSSIVAVNTAKSISLKLIPNPATDLVILSFAPVQQEATVSITDMNGRRLQTTVIAAGSAQVSLNVNSLIRGNYLIQVIDGSSISTTQFLKN